MAVALGGFVGEASNKTSGNQLVFTVPAGKSVPVGATIVVTTYADNISATTPTANTLVDSKGNTYTKQAELGQNAAAAAGIISSVWTAFCTTALAPNDTITLTLSGAVTAKGFAVEYLTGALATPAIVATPTGGASTTPSIGVTPTAVGQLVFAVVTREDNLAGTYTQDTDTVGGSWTGLTLTGTTGGGAATNVTRGGAYKVVTATGAQTYNPTIATTDWVAFALVFSPAPVFTSSATGGGVSGGSAAGASIVAASATGGGVSGGSAKPLLPKTVAVGSFVKPTSALGIQSITGLGFKPKAIMFWTTGSRQASGVWGQHYYLAHGITSGPMNSWAIAGCALDASNPSKTNRRVAAKAITMINEPAFNNVSECDLFAFTDDGFDLYWTTNGIALDTVINYIAFGGEIEADVVAWNLPTAAGNKSVTGVGFKPDLVFHISGALAPGNAVTSWSMFGMMNRHGQQAANTQMSVNATQPTDTQRWQQTDACIALLTSALAPYAESHFVSMDQDGFTTYTSTAPASATIQIVSLCIKGLPSKIGAIAKTMAAAPTTQSVDAGLPPKGLILSTVKNPAMGVPAARASWGLGASDGTAQRNAFFVDEDGQVTTWVDDIYRDDATYIGAYQNAGTPTEISRASAALTSTGFNLIFALNDINAADEIIYCAIGDA